MDIIHPEKKQPKKRKKSGMIFTIPPCSYSEIFI